MNDIKEFWLDKNKKYTRAELREIFKHVRPDDSFIVHYNGIRWKEHASVGNVEKLINRFVPDEIDIFTKDSPDNIIPRLKFDFDDSARLKYGSEFRRKFESEYDFDEFLNTNLSTFCFNYLLPKSLYQKYTNNSFYSWDLSFLCDDDRMQEKLSDAYNEKQRQFKQEIIKEYKIALEAYEAEIGTTISDEPDHYYTPRFNFAITTILHVLASYLTYTNGVSPGIILLVAFVASILIGINIVMLIDCWCDENETILDIHWCNKQEIFAYINALISMAIIFINHPQYFNIGGKFIMSLIN